MTDAIEPYRLQRLAEINAEPGSREALEAQHGQVWSTDELSRDFDVIESRPNIAVRRNSDGSKGSLEFQHPSKFYFAFSSHES